MTITTPKQISLEALRGFASAEPPCITVVLLESESRDARIGFKDALTQIRSQLDTIMSKHDVASFLAPLESAATETMDSSKEPATFMFLRSPGVCEAFRTHYLLGQPMVKVGECFHLVPLLELASKHVEFYILALKLNDTRIYKCTDQSFEHARFPKDAGTEAAGLVPGATQAEIHAKPVLDHDNSDEQLGHFYREVDRDVNALLKDGHPPLVVVGVKHEVALFLRLTTYADCVQPGIHALPGRFVDKEMYMAAMALVRSVTTGPTHQALEKFDKQIGTNHASSNLESIADAASAGRIEHLFLREKSPVDDVLDKVATQTLLHGGDVKVLPEGSMPGGVPVCAVFRYAATAR